MQETPKNRSRQNSFNSDSGSSAEVPLKSRVRQQRDQSEGCINERDSGFESNKPEIHETSSDEEKPRRRRRERGQDVTSQQEEEVSLQKEVMIFRSEGRSKFAKVESAEEVRPEVKQEVTPASEEVVSKQEVSKITLKQDPARARSRVPVQQEIILKQEKAPKEEVVHKQEVSKITLKPVNRSRSEVDKVETVIIQPEVSLKQEIAPREEIMYKQEVSRITLKKPQAEITLQQEMAPREEVMQKQEVSRISLKPDIRSRSTVVVTKDTEPEKAQTHTAFATFQVKPDPEVTTHKTFATLSLTVNANSGTMHNSGTVHTSLQDIQITNNSSGAPEMKVSENSAKPMEKTPPPVAPKTRKPVVHEEMNHVHHAKISSPVLSRRTRNNITPEKTQNSQTSMSERKAPVFTRKMQDFEVFEGDSARFDCQVSGEPEPDIIWLKDDEEISQNRRKYVFDHDDSGRCSLIIKNCTEEDDAVYECRASNSAGKADCSAELYVETAGSEEE